MAHLGIMLMALGMTGNAFVQQGKEELGVGQSMELGNYSFQIARIWEESTDNFVALHAQVNRIKDGKKVSEMFPEQRLYKASQTQASEVAIDVTPIRDHYVVLAGYGSNSSAEFPVGAFHIYINPLVLWVWIGSIVITLGTLLAMLPDVVPVRAAASVPLASNEELA